MKLNGKSQLIIGHWSNWDDIFHPSQCQLCVALESRDHLFLQCPLA